MLPLPEQRPERVRRLLALEISRIVEDLEARRSFLIDIWSRHRDRGPFLDTVFSRWTTLGFPDLALLPEEAMPIVEAFFRELDDWRLYVSYTQDMPTTLSETYDRALRRIARYGTLAVEALGGAPLRPVVEFEDEAEVLGPVEASVLRRKQPAKLVEAAAPAGDEEPAEPAD